LSDVLQFGRYVADALSPGEEAFALFSGRQLAEHELAGVRGGSATPEWAAGKQLWSKGKLAEHFAKHGAEVGARSAAEYSQMAKEFGSAENSGQFRDIISGSYFYRYEPATGRIFVGTTAGQKIKSFYVWDKRSDDLVISTLNAAGRL
jgi:hypothetical protein